MRATLFSEKNGKSVARNKNLPIFASSKALANRNSDFFHNLYIVFPLLFPHQEGFFVIFAENFSAMKLSKDQKNLLKGSLSAWAGMVVAMMLFTIFGKRTWNDTLWLMLGVTIAEIVVGLFLTLGSRVPKKKDENQ